MRYRNALSGKELFSLCPKESADEEKMFSLLKLLANDRDLTCASCIFAG